MLFTRSGFNRVQVNTPTNITELNWNRVPQPTCVCYPDRSRS